MVVWIASAVLSVLPVAMAGEVAPGTVIEASNWDTIKEQTFENHRIADLVPPPMELLVREYNLKLPLRRSEAIKLDPNYWELTERYANQVNYDPATREISGYVAGLPFPDVQRDAWSVSSREISATKLIWNYFLANPQTGDSSEIAALDAILVSGKSGFERVQVLTDNKFRMVGRLTEPHTIGGGRIYKRQVSVVLAPYDARGLGIYFVRYMDGQADDTYAYLKSVRRMRRMSGVTWMDPIGNTDILNEDNDLLDVYPTWYPSYRLLAEKTILAMTHGRDTLNVKNEEVVDLKNPPYWNPIGGEWEPRQVYVIEGTPPSFHLYGTKILYMEKEYPILYMSDIYDRQGNRWKIGLKGYHVLTSEEAPFQGIGPGNPGGVFIDLQKNHATAVVAHGYRTGNPKITEDDYSITAIQKMLR